MFGERFVAKRGYLVARFSFLLCRDLDVANWCLDFDQWMSGVVSIDGEGLAIGTEVGIIADGALVTIASNVSLV